MATPWAATLITVGLISLLSLIGLISLPYHVLRRHSVLFALIALAAGTLIGDAFFHLIPEGVEIWGGYPVAFGGLIVAGFLAFYVIEFALRIGHAHAESHHAPHDLPDYPISQVGRAVGGSGARHEHRPDQPLQPFGILNLVGDAVHNFLDGIVVAAAFLVDTTTGIATAIAVALHEIPQEFGDFGVLLRAGFRPLKAAAFNLMSAGFAIAGASIVLALSLETEALERYALPVVAGGFLYIAAADLVPELHHHTRGRFVPAVLALLVAGLALMALLTRFE